jgi:hypothetical protein
MLTNESKWAVDHTSRTRHDADELDNSFRKVTGVNVQPELEGGRVDQHRFHVILPFEDPALT